jgi:hypothetical protein
MPYVAQAFNLLFGGWSESVGTGNAMKWKAIT